MQGFLIIVAGLVALTVFCILAAPFIVHLCARYWEWTDSVLRSVRGRRR